MTLDEAIEHLQDKFEEDNWSCEECRQEHLQLLQWLMELKERREIGDKFLKYHLEKMVDEIKMLEELLPRNEIT